MFTRSSVNSRRAAASVAQCLAGLGPVASMVDRTTYPDDQVPELALRQVFGRQRLPENLCLLAAEVGLRTMDTFAMLGDNITGVKQTLNRIVTDPARFGADAAAQELALTNLTAVWKTCSACQDGRRSFEGTRNSG